MLAAVLSGYLGAFFAPGVHRLAPRMSGWICSTLPLALFLYFAWSGATAVSTSLTTSDHWVPSLGATLSFTLDGLSLLFALVITGVGSLVILYASGYLEGHHHLGRLYAFLLLFMGSMLGLVLAGNLIVLYVFWELTSISSYLLIGFYHRQVPAREAALQALLVTGSGGLALLAGLLLLGQAAGTFDMAMLMERGDAVRSHPLYLPALLLVLAGAFTKSAQVPFHFWLPSAMAAPTPVSAYLHSAAMVKAGLYLLARFTPVLGGTEVWQLTVSVVGLTTMLVGALMAFPQEDLKLLLAHSTVSALGTLTLLLGIGTATAINAFAVYLLAHVLYKGSFFLVAGAIDHATGTRRLSQLGGLRSILPAAAIAAGLAALSMAGVPPLAGFIGKELLYEANLQAPGWPVLISSVSIIAHVALVAVAALVALRPFYGDRSNLTHEPHPVSWKLGLVPLVPAGTGVLLGIFPALAGRTAISSAVSAIRAEVTTVDLALWHGVNSALLLGLLTVVAGGIIYAGRSRLLQALPQRGERPFPGPECLYRFLLRGIVRVAQVQTMVLQNGHLRYYLKVVLAMAVGLVTLSIFRQGLASPLRTLTPVFLHEWFAAGMIVAGALTAAAATSRLAAVAAIGSVGYGVALIYLLFGAPDLAMTQFCIETLTVILFALVLSQLPRFANISGKGARVADALVAVAGGAVMGTVALLAMSQPIQARISRFFVENSQMLAHGRNVVNVILVDFRGLDTLGEITVLAVAAVGIYGLIKFSLREED